jgi:hypothetical protein
MVTRSVPRSFVIIQVSHIQHLAGHTLASSELLYQKIRNHLEVADIVRDLFEAKA